MCIYSEIMNDSVFIMVLITTLVAMIYYSFIPFLSPGLLGDNCHAGWIGGFQDRCFKIVETRSTWAQAKGICKDIGGELTILDSQARNAFLVGNLALATSKLYRQSKMLLLTVKTSCCVLKKSDL